ncbi:MAG: hypothetical protein RL596_1073 [Bacteroidota bacterium]|jgi:pimeloyl-ACP methyl ester carboxylesterase
MKTYKILFASLLLAQTIAAQIPERPQTPKPPFNYSIEDIEFDNADKTVHYGATLTKPLNKKNFPTVILISGSGAQDRDGTLFNHKLYWVVADYLTKNGIAVLRIDDRGKGKTTVGPNPKELTSLDFSYDIETALTYLLNRVDIPKNKIGLIGHSEGGVIAPMLAARRKEIAFTVLWGAPIIGGLVTNTEQNLLALKKANIDSTARQRFAELHRAELNLYSYVSKENLPKAIDSVFSAWRLKLSPQEIKSLYVTDNMVVGQPAQTMYMGLYNIPWMRFFISYDPAKDLSKLKIPILGIIGAKDTQVSADENLALIQKITEASGNKKVMTMKMTDLNHLLQTAKTGELAEYEKITETISPLALELITTWINKQK